MENVLEDSSSECARYNPDRKNIDISDDIFEEAISVDEEIENATLAWDEAIKKGDSEKEKYFRLKIEFLSMMK